MSAFSVMRRSAIPLAMAAWAAIGLPPTARADTVQQPLPTVSSAFFPASGSGLAVPPMRQPGTFTLSVDDPVPGDAVRFEYDLDSSMPAILGSDPSPSVGGSGSGWVPVGPDGTATLTVTPTDWANWLDVRVRYADGSVSGQVRYWFATTWNGPDQRGDLNGDHKPDLVATTKDGRLHIFYGKGDGRVGSAVTYADSPTDFFPGLIAQNGDLTGEDGFQDLLRINPTGYMETVRNNGLGDFGQQVIGGWYRNDGSDWSSATQIALLGTSDGLDGGPLLSVEHGALLYWDSYGRGITGDSTVLDDAIGDATVVVPGDLTGDGNPDFLVREANSGLVRLAASKADGTFGSPDSWHPYAHRLPAAEYPLLTSIGDANGDGHPDLYAVTAQGRLAFIPGTADGFGQPQLLDTPGIDWSQVTQLA